MELVEKGVSLVICCYNSQSRITPTLNSVFLQSVPDDHHIEIILVDNNSKDDTVKVVHDLWVKHRHSLPQQTLRVISEPIQGLIHARHTGIKSSKYDIIVFADDDNELAQNYIVEAYELMSLDSSIGICGGRSQLPPDINIDHLPKWWNRHKGGFAIGDKGEKLLEVSYVWGAGLVLRKSVFDKLKQSSFNFSLVGRNGEALTSGEDQELCYAVRLLGYKIIYQPKLKLYHRIDISRIDLNYLESLHNGFGISHVYLRIYENYFRYGRSRRILDIFHATAYFILNVIRSIILGNSIYYIASKSRLGKLLSMSKDEYGEVVNEINRLLSTRNRM